MPLTSNNEEKHLFDLLRGQSYLFLNKAVSYWGNVQINTNCVKMINMQYSEKKKKKSYKLNTIRAKRKWNTWLSHSRLENSCSWSGHRSKIKHPVGNRSHDASQPIVTVRVVTHEALTGTSFSVYICETEAAECHVVVVKSSMEFNKRKATVITRWGRSSTPWCFCLVSQSASSSDSSSSAVSSQVSHWLTWRRWKVMLTPPPNLYKIKPFLITAGVLFKSHCDVITVPGIKLFLFQGILG